MSIATLPGNTLGYAPEATSRRWARPPAAAVSSPELPAINWLLLGIAGFYLAWSWIHLPSSIWARCLFACYLIWRMKPDIILPYTLTCFQLKLNFSGRSIYSELQASQIEDFSRSLTGYESYAFAIPCVLFAVRCFIASISAANMQRKYLPTRLYALYLAGAPFVIWAALSSLGTTGWTGGVRLYCMVGLYFYGLLMPGCGPRCLTGIAKGLLVVGTAIFTLALFASFMNRQIFLLMPFPPASVFGLIVSHGTFATLAVALAGSVSSLVAARAATFTMGLIWAWSAVASGLLFLSAVSTFARAFTINLLTGGALLFSIGFVGFAAAYHNPLKVEVSKDDTRWERLNYKLFADRGPIWFGAMKSIVSDPSVVGRPNSPYEVKSHAKTVMWPWSTHNVFLDLWHRLGLIAGSIGVIMLLYTAWAARGAIALDRSYGVTILGLAVIAAIIVGGTTVPYVTGDRQGEPVLIAAGMLGLYARRLKSRISA